MYGVIGYFVLLNLIGFIMMGSDKKRSQKGKWRVPELRLWIVGLLGGGVGAYWGMKTYRHKTKHKTFTIGMPLVAIINLLLYGWMMKMLLG